MLHCLQIHLRVLGSSPATLVAACPPLGTYLVKLVYRFTKSEHC